MATTTNYGWTTPDDTALVKDGASAIRTLGSSVDTTTKNLNPETTLGDLAYRSSTANVKTRLALGTAGQVLTVNSGATAPEWAAIAAGGMTSIASGSLSGSSTSITSISGSYKDLELIISAPTATSNFHLEIQLNTTTSSSYAYFAIDNINTTRGSGGDTKIRLSPDTLLTTGTHAFALTIFDYASTAHYKHLIFNGIGNNNTPTNFATLGSGGIRSTSAITSIQINAGAGTFNGGTYILYGVK